MEGTFWDGWDLKETRQASRKVGVRWGTGEVRRAGGVKWRPPAWGARTSGEGDEGGYSEEGREGGRRGQEESEERRAGEQGEGRIRGRRPRPHRGGRPAPLGPPVVDPGTPPPHRAARKSPFDCGSPRKGLQRSQPGSEWQRGKRRPPPTPPPPPAPPRPPGSPRAPPAATPLPPPPAAGRRRGARGSPERMQQTGGPAEGWLGGRRGEPARRGAGPGAPPRSAGRSPSSSSPLPTRGSADKSALRCSAMERESLCARCWRSARWGGLRRWVCPESGSGTGLGAARLPAGVAAFYPLSLRRPRAGRLRAAAPTWRSAAWPRGAPGCAGAPRPATAASTWRDAPRTDGPPAAGPPAPATVPMAAPCETWKPGLGTTFASSRSPTGRPPTSPCGQVRRCQKLAWRAGREAWPAMSAFCRPSAPQPLELPAGAVLPEAVTGGILCAHPDLLAS